MLTAGMISLGTWPTPIDVAPRLAARLGLDSLLIKRDDLGGLGGGGNKVRKLQYTCAEAVEAGARMLVTSGAPQSNHARLTAAAAARLGLGCILVLAGDPVADRRGNLLLDELAGAEIRWAGDRDPGEVVAEVVADHPGAHPIPFGGTSKTSIRGYADCARELLDQVPGFDHVVVAVGSGGTMAGLVSELGPQRVLGVDTGAVSDPRAVVAGLLEIDPAALRIDTGQIGAGYATITEPVREALRVTARTEGIFLDPTYTGRAMAALLAGGVHGRVIFLHTGGLPGLFAH